MDILVKNIAWYSYSIGLTAVEWRRANLEAMPLLALTEAPVERCLEQADSDLKYLLAEVGVEEEV